jgi:serine protease AprX
MGSVRLQKTVLACFAVAAVAVLGAASPTQRATLPALRAFVAPQLAATAQAHPQQVFSVIVQGTNSERTVVAAIKRDVRGNGVGLRRTLGTIDGASAAVTGAQLLALGQTKGVTAISLDRPVHLTSDGSSYWSNEDWPYAVDLQRDWSKSGSGGFNPPTIAIVDSGVQTNRADFAYGSHVLAQTTIVNTGTPNASGDGYGHGTFVAGIADGGAPGYAGTTPAAPIVSIDVLDDQGSGLTSDVIAACDWIVAHKDQYNIKVANFSLQASSPASVFWDPLDRAVEKLWFDGVTVVAASGNYGVNGQPTTVAYAPGNDPFVITVGADDIGSHVGSTRDDTAAPWSAYGYTLDGFAKPDIAAPGRYMVGPVPNASTLATTRASSMQASGYIQLSGTSFATPVVSGAAAYVLALHPNWTPDQVKGALMLSANPEPAAAPMSVGVGLVDIANAGYVSSPPNPNLAIDKFVGPDPAGGAIPVFKTSAWQTAALANPAWDAAAWGSAAWGSAAWGSAAWGSAAWGSAAWGSAAWGSAAWGSSSLAQSLANGSAAWGSAAWGSAAWGSAASADSADTK